jgi:hypothetical protein
MKIGVGMLGDLSLGDAPDAGARFLISEVRELGKLGHELAHWSPS